MPDDFETELLTRLGEAGRFRWRRMFGGMGIYHEGVIFAIAYKGAVYFRVDDRNLPKFVAHGMGPFAPLPGKAPMSGYHQLPEEILSDPAELRRWLHDAIAAAQQAATGKSG